MKKSSLIILILFTTLTSKEQEVPAKAFYSHLIKAVEAEGNDSINISAIEYGCLGSITKWDAVLKKQDGICLVNLYKERSSREKQPLPNAGMLLDTSYAVPIKLLSAHLQKEESDLKNQPAFIEGSFRLIITQNDIKSDFVIRKGQSLHYLLRHNRTLTSSFQEKKSEFQR